MLGIGSLYCRLQRSEVSPDSYFPGSEGDLRLIIELVRVYRQYAVRPTRTQILKNPKLATKLTQSLPPALEPKYAYFSCSLRIAILILV